MDWIQYSPTTTSYKYVFALLSRSINFRPLTGGGVRTNSGTVSLFVESNVSEVRNAILMDLPDFVTAFISRGLTVLFTSPSMVPHRFRRVDDNLVQINE